MKKKIFSMLICILTLLVFETSIYAIADFTGTPKPLTGADAASQNILGYIQWVGYAIAIGMLVYVGIKYITASANDKAELKNAMVKYVIGALLIAGATAIASWIFTAGAGIGTA